MRWEGHTSLFIIYRDKGRSAWPHWVGLRRGRKGHTRHSKHSKHWRRVIEVVVMYLAEILKDPHDV